MFEMDNTKNNSAITDYNSKYPKYTHTSEKKRIRRVKGKLHQKTSISLTIPFP